MQIGQATTGVPASEADYGALSLEERLTLLVETHDNAVFTTSLGMEDQVLTHALSRAAPEVRIVTLETGRLFEETVRLIERTEALFGVSIERFRPEEKRLGDYVARFGLNGFYESVEARHACCGVRKLEPLARALAGADLWITGLRRGQSSNRADVPFVVRDGDRGLLKANPLADWDIEAVRAYADQHDVPLNPLHAQGFPSIGCEPCTRAVKPGEDERAGRWWWENDAKRECGLHVAGQETPPQTAQ
ncbi:phosphoadenylyl-sulfate reductase [Hoeflea prorocentri]|uniref:Adenosine 5'-phosphosulfate reductase n=1 Tax=Hoeflea prorocentri TaxID=1922333 RepID=A0A9X3ZFX1_9HYPH|nr:phosphoadenylyl-sulfate reductase [Hoeflea prorocentri]MCY6379215.1 phosphoadenylyl-sulfate reductase [Hoeflea prorocentri]MDA5397016.1 phosphoadenylyl-sulfate reductase [Hoeflea prorocentri]